MIMMPELHHFLFFLLLVGRVGSVRRTCTSEETKMELEKILHVSVRIIIHACPILRSLSYLPTYLPTYLPHPPNTHLPTYLPTHLPTYLPTYLPFFHLTIKGAGS